MANASRSLPLRRGPSWEGPRWLSEKHRSTIYQRLVPILGDEEAQALVSQFPATDLETPATKDFVHAEIADLRADMHDLLRRQTLWIIGANASVVVAVATMSRLLG